MFIGVAPAGLSYLTNKPCTATTISISYRGAILWNAVSTNFTGQFTVFNSKVKKDSYFKELDFKRTVGQVAAQVLPRFKMFLTILCFKCCSQFT